MENHQLTKYPKIFENTNWGGAKVGTYAGKKKKNENLF